MIYPLLQPHGIKLEFPDDDLDSNPDPAPLDRGDASAIAMNGADSCSSAAPGSRPKAGSRALFDMIYPLLQPHGIKLEFPDPDLPSFDIGTRYRDKNGRLLPKPIPMSCADALYPWEGDELAANTLHFSFIMFLCELATVKFGDQPGFVWQSDGEFDFGLPEHGIIRPDAAFLTNVVNQLDPALSRFCMDKEPPNTVRFMLALEVTSPSTRKNDFVDKLTIYRDGGVEQYVIIDILEDRVELWDFRPTHSLDPCARSEDGRIYIESLNVWMVAEGKNIYFEDGETGERIVNYREAIAKIAEAKQEADRLAKRVKLSEKKAKAAEKKAKAAEEKAKAAEEKAKAAEERRARMAKTIEELSLSGGDAELMGRLRQLLDEAGGSA